MSKRVRFPFVLGILFIATASFAACGEAGEASETHTRSGSTSSQAQTASDKRATSPADLRQVVEGNNRFAFDLYRELGAGGSGNLFFSPTSISVALAMTLAGARGDTEQAMTAALRLPEGSGVHPAFGSLMAAFNDRGGDAYQLHVANRLWVHTGTRLLPQYLELTRRHYGAEPASVDYVRKTEEARLAINTWVAERTADRIRDLVPPGALDRMTRLVLTNAVYFKGTWLKQFEKAATQNATFHVSVGEQVEVPLMVQSCHCRYGEQPGLQIIELPYKGGELSMVVLLPKEIDGLKELESRLSPGILEPWLSSLTQREVMVYLPRFRMESEFQLEQSLAKLGMGSAFSPDADFSGLDGTRELYLSAAIHKAFVEVNEEGTEAAAATAVVVRAASAAAPPPLFRADRPFVFMIRHQPTGSILFLGRVVRP
jgi:serpin B